MKKELYAQLKTTPKFSVYRIVTTNIKFSIGKIKNPSQGRSERERRKSPNGEKLLEKIDLISKGSIFSKRFPKLVKNSIFLLNFDQNFLKFSQNFQTVCIFRPKARKISAKINAWFVSFLKNMLN